MDEFSYDLKIPEDRVAVLIGSNGKTKKDIEAATKTTLDIENGDVIVTGSDAMLLYTARQIIKAIARGFNPRIAMLLLKQDYALEVIDVSDYSGKSKNTLHRIKARLIGTEGKAQKEIEHLANVDISVYGKTVAVIGVVEDVTIGRQALELLIKGSMHKTVFQFLEKKRKQMMFG